MAEEVMKSRLGRGLAALIGDVEDDAEPVETARGQRRVPVEFLRPNPRNPRKNFAEAELDELAASVRERGIIQPILVRPLGRLPDAYEIIAGERRWRAAQRAGLHQVPVVVLEADDRTALEYAIIENVQRSDLNALEEAAGYDKLIAEFSYTHSDLADAIGKSRSHVANTIRLLKLPPPVQQMMVRGELSAGHARALLSVEDPVAVAEKIVAQGLTVRDVERLGQARTPQAGAARPERTRREKDPDTRALEAALEDILGLVVEIAHRGQGGELRIRYGSLDQLDALCRRLRVSAAA
jgi:ParB family chromosome partitioning protein